MQPINVHVSSLLISLTCVFPALLLNHIPRYLDGLSILLLIFTFGWPIIIFVSSLGIDELITITSEISPFIFISLISKNSSDILIIFSILLLLLATHTVSSTYAAAALLSV